MLPNANDCYLWSKTNKHCIYHFQLHLSCKFNNCPIYFLLHMTRPRIHQRAYCIHDSSHRHDSKNMCAVCVVCVCAYICLQCTNLDGIGGYLYLMQLPHRAVTVNEVGRGQLMKGFHVLSSVGELPVQLVFGQVHSQRLLSYRWHGGKKTRSGLYLLNALKVLWR